MPRRLPLTPVLESRLSAFVEALPAALTGDAVAVHQARVASRRLRELVPVLTRLGDRDRRLARRLLRRMTRTLGRVREADVSAQRFEAVLGEHPVPAVAASAVRRAASALRADALRTLRQTWSRRRRARLDAALATLRRAAAAGARADAALAATSRLLARERRTRRPVDALGVLYAADRLHAVRIAVKRWRYTLELTAEVARRRPPAALTVLRQVQDDLGRAHDLHVLAVLLRDVEARVVTRSRSAAGELKALARRLDDECRAVHAAFLRNAPLSGPIRPGASRHSPARPRTAA